MGQALLILSGGRPAVSVSRGVGFEGNSEMDLITSRPAMTLRGLVRRLRANYGILNNLFPNKREKLFEIDLISEAKSGDIAWDIGAFRGKYTKKLSQGVGSDGQVFAFEPNPQSREQLLEKLATEKNVTVLPVALGSRCESVNFLLSRGRSRVVSDSSCSDVAIVRMETGDAIVRLEEAASPNLIKIDAEGLELDILQGLRQTLESPALRAVFIEVHFQLLAERYPTENVPAEIVALLKSCGFRIRWVSPSHIAARRSKLS
jgi:FkbM family methyltransferase